jgi:hypothetical protein
MAKPRADAKLLNLPPEEHEWLVELLFTAGMSYDRARPLVRERLGFAVSNSSLSSFWEQCCAPRLLQRRGQSAAAAQAIAADAEQNGGIFTAATLAMLRQKAFDLLVDSNANPDDVRGLLALALKARDQDQKSEQIAQSERRLKLLEAREDDTKQTLANPALSAADKEAKIKRIFGLA